MDLTTFTNQYIFPFFLLIVFLITFHQPSKIDRPTVSSYPSTITNNKASASSQLEQFYEIVEQNESLLTQIETIITDKNFAAKMTVLGNSLGYQFSVSDIETTITHINDNYVCLPIGCWHTNISGE